MSKNIDFLFFKTTINMRLNTAKSYGFTIAFKAYSAY